MKSLLVTLFCVTICFGAKSQTIDTLIDVGGYRLHFNIIKGKGIPILFESGGGDDGKVWDDLTKKLYDSIGTTLITYDRAGTGKSEIDTSKINILNEIKGLETGLKKLGFTHNLFLVAHSLGGSYSILYSSRNSKKVSGCVFIDINLPCFMTEQKTKEISSSYANIMDTLKKQRIGVYYLLSNYENTNDLLRATTFPSRIPSTIIGSDFPPYKGVDSVKWKSCIKSFGMLTNHTYVLGKNCGHYIFKDNPDLVINEIIKLYRQVDLIHKKQLRK
jgi:pimeloyl-ACP methyl ester carboxylesterase